MSFLRYKIFFLFLLFIMVGGAVMPFSARAIIYQPGQTLDPSCAPADENCSVAAPGSGNIVPDADAAYDLGSPTRQWRDLYISGNTLHLGGLSLSASASTGALVWSGSSIETTPSATSTSELKLSEITSNGTNFVGLKAPDSVSASTLWVLPGADGSTGQTLSTDGSGALSWVSREPAVAAGATTQYFRGDKTFQTLDTSVVLENGNVYYTSARFDSSFAGKSTGNLAEGINLYWTTARGDQNFASNLSATTADALVEGSSNKYYTDARFDNRFALKTTNNLIEGGNLYYTDTRVRNALSVSAPLSYSTFTGAFNILQASSAANGYLSSTDWNTFNNKQSATLNNGLLWIGNASNIATAVALSGEATINNAGMLIISDGVVTLSKLAADAVNSAKIVDGSIALADFASGSVDSAKIVDATITNADVSTTAAILYSKLTLGNSIVLSDLTADSVNSSKVVDGSIVAADLAFDAITSAKILDGTITNADVSATAAIALSKLASGTSGQIIMANASGAPVYVAISGDAAVSNTGALTIANLAVTNAKLAADSVTSEKILDGTIVAADIGADAVTTVKILDGNITMAKILDANVTLAKLAANSVDSSKIVDGAITSADIFATAGITNSQLANSTIGLSLGTSGTDVNVSSPAALGNSLTLNIPDAGATARGLVTTGAQTFAGDKTFYGGLKTESTVGAIMTAGSDGAFAYNFGSGVSNSLSKRVAQSSDDAEQSLATNGVNLTSSDLELINDNGVDQEVGIRFQNITIPQGATITNAYIEFTTDAVTTGTTNLNFYGEAADDAVTFTSTTNNITGRTKTSSTVAWSAVSAWNTIGATNQTPNLAPLVQEIVNRAGWLSGNSLAIIINGTAGSLRNAVSYNGGASSAALLVVQYTTNSTNVSYVINNLGPGLFRINDEFNDTSPFIVDSSGNVGIGTSTPSNTLSVAGNSTLSGTLNVSGVSTLATTTSASLALSPMAQGSLLFAGAGGLISQNNSNLFWDNNNSRLGVGASSPNARLYVKTADLTSTPFYIEGQDNAFTGLSGWFYRKPVVIDNTANSVSYSNQQVFVSVDTASLISAGKLQSNCADLRFTNTDGATILPHWIEYGCNSAATGIWVKIPTLPAGITKTIYAYYGNPTATSTSSGAGVFTFFDDFPTNQARFYNTEYSGWTVQTGSWIIPSGNYLANYYGGDMITINSPSAGIGAAVRAKMTETSAWKYARLIIGWQDANNYYAATLNSGGGQLNIYKVVGGTQTLLASINASVAAGTWYEVELRWISSTVIEAQIWDVNGNSLGVAQGAISEGWTGGKFGAHGINGTSTARYENYMTMQYAPNITFNAGAEEISGAPQQLPFFVVKNQTGKIGIGETNPGAKLSVSGGLAIGSDFDTTSVSDGDAIFSGRLGVGVISPTNALTFAASSVIDSQGALSITTASDGALSLTSNGSGNVVIDSGTSGALNIGTGANGKTITLGNTIGATGLAFNSGSGNINFDNNTFYIDVASNRVGIGVNAPAAALEIVGPNNSAGFKFSTGDMGAVADPFLISGTDIGSASSNLFKMEMTNNTTGSNNQTIASITNNDGSGITESLLELQTLDSDTTGNFLVMKDPAGAAKFAFKLNGNLGIGTSTPSTSLHVVGDALVNSQASAVGAAATQRGLQITAGSLGANDGTIRGIDISATVAGTTNIGDELTGLRVESGAIDANGTTRGLHIVQPSTVGAFGSVVKDLLTLERQGGTLTNALQYIDAGATKFVLNSAGNVGLGTTTPSASLHIVPSTAVALRIDPFATSTGSTGELRFQELAANGINYVGFKSPDSLAGNVLYTLPTTDGLQNQILTTDGAGGLSWATAAVSASAMPQLVDETVQQGGIGNIFIYRNQLYAMGDSASALGEDGVYDALTPIVVPIQNPPSGWTQVVATYDTACALSNVGTVYCWGKNNYGQLGDSSTTDNFKYAKQISNGEMPAGTVITKIFTNRNRAYSVLGGVVFALASDGKLYAWGANYQGQIGDGTTTQRNTPVLVGSAALVGKIITKVSVNGTERVSVAAIDSTGQLYTWGYNEVGQLGQGDTTQRTSPTAVAGFTNASDVISSGDHTWNGVSGSAQNYIVVLKNNGTVWAAGANGYGQLGDGSTTQRNNFTQESTLRTDISKIYAGGFMNTAMVSATGYLYLTGYNGDGQLGDNTTTNRNAYFAPTGSFQGKVSKVQIGGRVYTSYGFNYILDTDGNVWAAGRNAYGQLGKGNTTGGATYFTKSLRNTDGKKVIDIRTFGFEDNSGTIILLEDGSLMATGNNSNGESGNTVQAAYSTSFRYVHGFEPGSKSTTVGSTVPMNLLSGAQSSNTIDNTNYTQALNWSTLTSGTGLALSGAGLTSGSLASLSAASPNFSGSVLNLTSSGDSGSVTGALAGLNISGATSGATGLKITNTGVGLSADISGAVAFRKGVDYSTAGSTNDASFGNTSLVRLTGANPTISGIAGGTDGKILTIMNVSGTTATFQNQNLGSVTSNRIITGTGGDLVLGADSSVNLQYDSSVLRWRIISSLGTVGAVASTPVNNYIPQLMDASIIFGRLGNIFIYRNQLYSMGLGSGYPYGPSGDAIGNNAGTPSLVPVNNPPSGWNKVVGTYDSACALSNVGTVYCWGLNNSGQLGQGDTTARYLATKVTFPGDASTITSITTNANFEYSSAYTTFYAIDSTGKVWAWGANNWGQLGDGTTVNKTTPAQVGSAVWAGKAITKISASGTYAAHAAALDSAGQLYTWGYNGVGELGQGDVADRSNPTAVSGFTSVTDVKTMGGHNGTTPVGETFVLKNDGTVWGAGRNADGELGDGTTINRSSFVQATGVSGITSIFVGEHNAAVVNSSGNVSLTGWNGYGQLGNSSTANALTYISPSGAFQGKVSKVVITGISSSGAYVTIYILDTDGNLWTAGYNGRGQLGVGGTVNTAASTPGIFQKVVRNTDGAKIVDVSAFGYDTRGGALIVLDNGAMMTTGDNQQGAAGNDTLNQNYSTTFKYVIGFEPGSKVYTTASSPSLSSLVAASAANTIDNTNWTQTLNWSTLTSGAGLSFGSGSVGLTGDLVKIEITGNGAGVTGNALKVGITGASSTVTALNIANAGAGLSFRVNDDGTYTDASPFVIDANGNVGIGTTTPSQILHIVRSTDGVVARFTDANGDCDINPTTTALVCASDVSLKKNVVTMDSALEKTLALNPVIFDWNREEDGAGNHIGFIAQEVEELFPALVFTNEQGIKSVAYTNFVPILVKAVQDLSAEVEKTKVEIASLSDVFKQTFAAWFADATNGIADFFAKKIHTEKICLKKSDGNEYCVNGDDLEAIMGGRGEVISAPVVEPDGFTTGEAQTPVVESILVEGITQNTTENNMAVGTEIIQNQELELAIIGEISSTTASAEAMAGSPESALESVQISDETVSPVEPTPEILDSTDESNAILPIETAPIETAPEITSLPESLPVITGATITE